MNNVSVTFKVDTGAEVTAISEDTLKTLGTLEVKEPTKKLCGPNGLNGQNKYRQHKLASQSRD